jgi:hypothetical protein
MEDLQQARNANERRCSATTKRGRCRVTRGVNVAGLCPMHAGTTDPRELGRRSGKARRAPRPDRVHPELGAYLLAEVHPERIWRTLEAAMLGQNESARVAASRVVIDALAAARPEGCPTCRQREAEADAVSAKAEEKLTGLVIETVRAILTGNLANAPGFARIAADKLPEDLEARIAELGSGPV